jgi:hypothetical protein
MDVAPTIRFMTLFATHCSVIVSIRASAAANELFKQRE